MPDHGLPDAPACDDSGRRHVSYAPSPTPSFYGPQHLHPRTPSYTCLRTYTSAPTPLRLPLRETQP